MLNKNNNVIKKEQKDLMSCLLKKHRFIRKFDVVLGGLLSRHVHCKNCNTEYAIWWHIDKPHKPRGKSIRIKISGYKRICPIA